MIFALWYFLARKTVENKKIFETVIYYGKKIWVTVPPFVWHVFIWIGLQIDWLIDWCDIKLECVSCPLPITHWNINKFGRSIQNAFIYLWAVTLPNSKQAHFSRHLAFINSFHWISTAWSAFLFPSFSGSIFHENWGNWLGYDNMDAYLLLFILNVPFNHKLDLNQPEINLMQFIRHL